MKLYIEPKTDCLNVACATICASGDTLSGNIQGNPNPPGGAGNTKFGAPIRTIRSLRPSF